MENNNVLLNIENLHVHFVSTEETVKALNGVDLKVEKGKTILRQGLKLKHTITLKIFLDNKHALLVLGRA